MEEQTEVQATKPTTGVLTSEFAVTAGTVASMLLGLVPEKYAPIVGGLAGLYAALRTMLKAVHVYRSGGK